jgi:hypothetical protein
LSVVAHDGIGLRRPPAGAGITERAIDLTFSENDEILCRFSHGRRFSPWEAILPMGSVHPAQERTWSRFSLFSCRSVGPIAIPMPSVDTKRAETVCEDERQAVSPLVYAFVILSVFVLAVIRMWVEDGASTAVVTAVVVVAIAGTAIGLCGTALAVKETDELGSRPED